MNTIVSDPKVMNGQPILKWTRLTVRFVLEMIWKHNVEWFMENYPGITIQQIQDVILYSARYLYTQELEYT